MKLVHLVGFITKKFVTMHGHMNVMYCVFVCGRSYPTCSALRHIVICGLHRSTVFFPNYLIKCTILEKKLFNTKYVLCFPLKLLSEVFLILKRAE